MSDLAAVGTERRVCRGHGRSHGGQSRGHQAQVISTIISIYLQYLHIYRSGYLGAWSPHTHGHPLVCSTWAVAASTLYLGQVVSVISILFL